MFSKYYWLVYPFLNSTAIYLPFFDIKVCLCVDSQRGFRDTKPLALLPLLTFCRHFVRSKEKRVFKLKTDTAGYVFIDYMFEVKL